MKSMRIVQVDCPAEGCDKALAVELNADFDKMSALEIEDMENKVRARFLTRVQAHHNDGHPKEETNA